MARLRAGALCVRPGAQRHDGRATGLPLRQLGDQEAPSSTSCGRSPSTPRSCSNRRASALPHREGAAARRDAAARGRCGSTCRWTCRAPGRRGRDRAPARRRRAPPTPTPLSTASSCARQVAALLDRLARARARSSWPAAACARRRRRRAARRRRALGAPVATAWNAHDLLWEDHPLFVGRPGTIGDRAGNFAVQNADLLLSPGLPPEHPPDRLRVRGLRPRGAGGGRRHRRRRAAQAHDHPDVPVHTDAGFFLDARCRQRSATGAPRRRRRDRRRGSPGVWHAARATRSCCPSTADRTAPVNPYVFVDELSDACEDDDIVVMRQRRRLRRGLSGAAACKRGQRLIANSGTAGMGYDLPAAIGACARAPAGAARRLSGRRRQHPDEPAGAADDRPPRAAGQDLRLQQRRATCRSARRRTTCLPGAVRRGPEQRRRRCPTWWRWPAPTASRRDGSTSHATLSGGDRRHARRRRPGALRCRHGPEQQFAPKVAPRSCPTARIVSKPLEDMWPFMERAEIAENMLVPHVATAPKPSGRHRSEASMNALEHRMVDAARTTCARTTT